MAAFPCDADVAGFILGEPEDLSSFAGEWDASTLADFGSLSLGGLLASSAIGGFDGSVLKGATAASLGINSGLVKLSIRLVNDF